LQFLLDWQGWCNARAGAVCNRDAYWNVAGNWENNAIPNGLSTDVRIGVGQTVRLSDYRSIYRGYISSSASAGFVFAEGRVEIGNYGRLTVGNGGFADLYFFPGGSLETSGLSTVYNLSSGAGEFRGAGVTELRAWQPSTLGQLDLFVKSGHTLRLASGAPSTAVPRVRMEPNARLENTGVLNLDGGDVSLQGTANGLTLPVFDNLGTLFGAGSVQTTRFNNNGSVLVAAGDALRIGMFGTHTGSFVAGLGSSLSFGGTFTGGANTFQTGSSLMSAGSVFADRGSHVVNGNWDVATLEARGGSITFNSTPRIQDLRVVNSFSQASFNGAVGVLNLRLC